MKYWEIIADKLSAAGWWGAIAARSRHEDGTGLLTHIVETGAATFVQSDELLSAFLELEQNPTVIGRVAARNQ